MPTWSLGHLCQGALTREHVDERRLAHIRAPYHCKLWQLGLGALVQGNTARDVGSLLHSHLHTFLTCFWCTASLAIVVASIDQTQKQSAV